MVIEETINNEIFQEKSEGSIAEDSPNVELNLKDPSQQQDPLNALDAIEIKREDGNDVVEEIGLPQGQPQIINRRPFFTFPKQNVALAAATTATGAGIILNLVDHPAPKTIGALLSTAGFFGVQASNAWTRQGKRRPIQEEYIKFQKKTQRGSQIELQKLRPIIDDYGLHLNRRDKACDRFIHLLWSLFYIAAGALLIARAFDENHSLPLGLSAGGSIFLALFAELMTHIIGNNNLDRYLLQLKDANDNTNETQNEVPQELENLSLNNRK